MRATACKKFYTQVDASRQCTLCIDSEDVYTYLSNIDTELAVQDIRVETSCSCGRSIVVCHISSNSVCSTCGKTERVIITLDNSYDMLGRTVPCIYKRTHRFKSGLFKFLDIHDIHKAKSAAIRPLHIGFNSKMVR